MNEDLFSRKSHMQGPTKPKAALTEIAPSIAVLCRVLIITLGFRGIFFIRYCGRENPAPTYLWVRLR